MTMLLRWIERKNLIGIAVLSLVMGFNDSVARAQLGATKQTASAVGKIEELFFVSPAWSEYLKLEPMVLKSRLDKNTYYLGFKDDKVALLEIPKRPDADRKIVGVPNSVMVDCIARTLSFDDNQKPTYLDWRIDTTLNALFPPIGDVRSNMVEILRPTGVQTRQITINGFGDIISASPWQSIMRGTGNFRPNTTSSFYCRVLLKSRDGNSIAVIYAWGTHSDVERSVQHVEYAAAMTADAFWEFAIISISKGMGFGAGDNYEGHLARYVPQPFHEKVTAQRLASTIVCCTDSSSIPMETVLQRYHDARQENADLETVIRGLLLKSNFTKLGPIARERHYRLAGETGDVGLLPEFAKKVPAEGNGKEQAVAAMARIAERYQLEPPPKSPAQIAEVRAWATRVAKGK